MARLFLGVVGLAERLGVSRHAVHKWRARYGADSSHPFPAPDIEVDGAPGWEPERLDEVVRWRAELPGRGIGGGRPTAARRGYLAAAMEKGLDRDEAARTLKAFMDEFPEMTEAEVAAWLIGKWEE